MNIRRLVPADATVYRTLMLDAYGLHPEAFTSSVAERFALPISWWASRLADSDDASQRVMGAFRQDQLAGVAGISFESREKARHKTTLFGMYVPSRFRQLGLGRQLVEAALVQARERPGVRLMQLTVTEGNAAALALYQRCGFVQFGLEPQAVAVGETFVSKIHMWCDLRTPIDTTA